MSAFARQKILMVSGSLTVSLVNRIAVTVLEEIENFQETAESYRQLQVHVMIAIRTSSIEAALTGS